MGWLFILLLLVNFGISWWNAYAVGKVWTESKNQGGLVRVSAWAGYIMSISGFTMVYAYILMFITAYGILPMTKWAYLSDSVISLSSDMTFVLIAIPIVGSGIVIWIQSLVVFWRRKTIGNALVGGWNTYAQISNTITVARELPSAFGRILDSTKKVDKDGALLVIAALIVAVAALGGYFTASAIRAKADKSYDFYLEAKNKAEGTPGATWQQPVYTGRTDRGMR